MKPIDLQFDKISMSNSESSSSHKEKEMKPMPTKDTFSRHQFDKFKKDVLVSGTWYNMCTFSLVTFVGVFLVLLVFRPPLVMTTVQKETDLEPVPVISWTSILVWSFLASIVVFAIAFFTRPKSSPSYVLEK